MELKRVDIQPIQRQLEGLIRNMDEDLLRRIRRAEHVGNAEEHRQLTLLLVMLRLANNSHEVVSFLLSDTDYSPRRKPRFVTVLPPINRQVMDLWFNLAYMNDDFPTRSLLYEKSAYRELRKQMSRTDVQAATPEWHEEMENLAKVMEGLGIVTSEEQSDPEKLIPSWPHPHGLSKRQTASSDFLQFLHRRIYEDTSVESHLKAAGLFMSAGILLRDVLSEAARDRVENRDLHVYKARQFFRSVTSLLGVVSEIELRCNLNNREQAAKVWGMVAEHHLDAEAIFVYRYRDSLAKMS